MLQVSRDSNLKIPKKLEDFNGAENSIEDKVAVKQAIATAENKRFNKKEDYKLIITNQIRKIINENRGDDN